MFQSLATADFTSIVRDMEEVVRATASDSATTVETSEDNYGFSWLILRQGAAGDAGSGDAGSADAGSADAGSADAGSADAGGGAGVTPELDFDGLVVGINAVSGALQAGGYGDRVLCSVFAFQDARGRPLYWIYNYKRGTFYPFVPKTGDQQRDNERELVLKAQIGKELPVEPELSRWFPLWGAPV